MIYDLTVRATRYPICVRFCFRIMLAEVTEKYIGYLNLLMT